MWEIARDELHALIQKPELAHIPLLVLATKNDLPDPVSTERVVEIM